MPSPLARARRAAAARRRSEVAYRSALLAAVDAGHTYAEVARAAGVSRQAVRELATRRR